jgi:hypothetical protein
MALEATAPVSELEGIGPAIAEALRAIAIHTVFDLLRADARRIHAAVSSIASLAEVRRWRQMAALLEVDEVTAQWAEALVAAGVIGIHDLRGRGLDDLQSLFAAARERNAIPDVPSANQIADMLKDAALLDRSGALMGTARNVDGDPIAGVIVRAGGYRRTTDERGRFRLARLPLGAPLGLHLWHPDYRDTLRTLGRIPSVREIHVLTVEMHRRTGAPQTAERPLAELEGDVLPVLNGQNIAAVEVPRGELRENDVLRLILLYANGTEAKLVSKLLEYREGEYRVRWARVPLAELPEAPVRREHYRLRNGRFVRIHMDGRKLDAYRRLLEVKRQAGQTPRLADPVQFDQALAERVRALKEAGLLRRARRGV